MSNFGCSNQPTPTNIEEYQSGQMGWSVKPLTNVFVGSNPTSSTKGRTRANLRG